jgi:Xaa-Pro aminopeptidase
MSRNALDFPHHPAARRRVPPGSGLVAPLVLASIVAGGAEARPDARGEARPADPRAAVAASASTFPVPEPPGPEIFRARREKLRKSLAGGVALLYGAEAGGEGAFRQDPFFFYLTGVEEAGAALVLAPEEAPREEVLFLAPRNPEAEWWSGGRDPLGSALEALLGFENVYRTDRLAGFLREATTHAKKLYLLRPPGAFSSPVSRELETLKKIQERTPGAAIEDRSALLVRMRQIKSPEELAAMRAAIEATALGIRAAMAEARPGRTEFEVQAALEAGFRAGGARRPAFPSICATGRNTTVLHYQANRDTIREGDLFLLDVGAEIHGYAADVSRTFPVSGRFPPRAREIYDLVLRAQEAGIAAVRPGARYREDVHGAARKVIREAGKGDAFLHGTGHFVGLETHDVGDYGAVLEPGMVLTVEPGVYLPDLGIGVRIEDEVLVTEKGCEVLTRSIPKSVAEIESLLAR